LTPRIPNCRVRSNEVSVCLATLPFFGLRSQVISQNSDVLAPRHARGSCPVFNARRPMMATGTVKFFNVQKGFGFIQPTDGSRDVFVHISAVERAGMRSLIEGQKVSYDIVTERGKQAAANLQSA